MGTIYRRKFKDKNGNTREGKTFWIKYYHGGKPIYESTKSDKWADAANLLKQREGDAASGKPPGVRFDKVMFAELVEDILEDYKLKGQKKPRHKRLKRFFGSARAVDITTAEIKRYINHRLEQGASNGTINRELSALKRMFKLGKKETPPKVNQIPHIEKLKEDNVKEGFFEDAAYHAISEQLPEHMKGVVQFAYWTAWREAQIRSLTWKMVKINDRLITAAGRITKNSKPHTIYMNGPVLEIIKQRRSERNLGCPYVFHRNGHQVKDFRSVWNTACRNAGLGYGYKISKAYTAKWEKKFKPGPTIHDFRRTAARNMRRAGVAENTIMQIGGWKTRSVLDRYDIHTVDDLRQGAEKQAQYINGYKYGDKSAENDN
jgi:integrase